MARIFYDRMIDNNFVCNGISEDWIEYFYPEFNPTGFRSRFGFEPPVYPSDINTPVDNVERYSIDEIPIKFKDTKGCLGIFPIEGFGNPDRSLGTDVMWNKSYGSSMSYFSDTAVKYIREGRLKLFYGLIQEAFLTDDEMIGLHKEMVRFDFYNGLVAVNDFLLKQRYEQWCIDNDEVSRYDVIVYNHSLFEKAHEVFCILNGMDSGVFGIGAQYSEHKNSAMTLSDFKDSKRKERKSNFLSLNRRMRSYRQAVLCVLQYNNLIENNLVSFTFKLDPSFYELNNLVSKEKYKMYRPSFQELKDMKTKIVDYPLAMDGRDGLNHGYGFENCKPYMDSYCSIVTETRFEAPTGYVSEKSWKPIAYFQPFILVGSTNSLQYMREFGFKTFHPFIDESYDNHKNPKKRFSLIENEIIRIGKMTKKEIHEWYWSMEDILVHNHKLFLEYAKEHNNRSFITELFDSVDSNELGILIPNFRKEK
tara:strand:- start:1429 stop:2859 length:1431 start_codon:yes stop_codon:yes gene_type:complete